MPVESSACLSATIEERVRRTIANAPQTRVSRAPSKTLAQNLMTNSRTTSSTNSVCLPSNLQKFSSNEAQKPRFRKPPTMPPTLHSDGGRRSIEKTVQQVDSIGVSRLSQPLILWYLLNTATYKAICRRNGIYTNGQGPHECESPPYLSTLRDRTHST